MADELKSETAGLEAVNNGILRMILFINQFNQSHYIKVAQGGIFSRAIHN